IKKSKFAKIINCYSEGNRIGYGNRGSGETLFDGVTAYNNVEDGIRLRLGSNGDQIVNSQIALNGEDGISFEGDYAGNAIVNGNRIYENRRGVVAGSESGKFMENIKINDNEIYHNRNEGVYIYGSSEKHKDIIVSSNRIYE